MQVSTQLYLCGSCLFSPCHLGVSSGISSPPLFKNMPNYPKVQVNGVWVCPKMGWRSILGCALPCSHSFWDKLQTPNRRNGYRRRADGKIQPTCFSVEPPYDVSPFLYVTVSWGLAEPFHYRVISTYAEKRAQVNPEFGILFVPFWKRRYNASETDPLGSVKDQIVPMQIWGEFPDAISALHRYVDLHSGIFLMKGNIYQRSLENK